MLTPIALSCIAAIALAGWLIGATGIGGVLVVPALTRLADVPVQQAVAASAMAFAFPATVALAFLASHRPRLRAAVPLAAGALPGAALGASLVHHLDTRIVLVLIAALALFSGAHALRTSRKNAPPVPGRPLAAGVSLGLGAAVGAGSALTGTGGPVLLGPLLLLLGQPLAVVLAGVNVIQMPVAVAASWVHWRAGALDPVLAMLVGSVLLVASIAGQVAARKAHGRTLHVLLAILLLAVGAWTAWSVIA